MLKSYQAQYANILEKIIGLPRKKSKNRNGNTHSRFVEQIRIDVRKEFPLMDIKWIKFSNILHELLWFINGDTNIKYLKDNKCNVWDKDAFRYYNEKYVSLGFPELTIEEFLKKVENSEESIKDNKSLINRFKSYKYGDLDKIYSYQWRSFNGKTDQLKNCVDTLKKDPDNRRIIVTGHNPTDIEENNVGLPSCHNYFQFYSEEIGEVEKEIIAEYNMCDVSEIQDRFLNIFVNIRSNDMFLGNPYNVPSYSILLMIIAKLTNMIPREVVINMVDCHLYNDHIEPAKEWLKRYNNILYKKYIGSQGIELRPSDVTWCESKLKIKDKDYKKLEDFKFEDFELFNYNPQNYIKAKLLA